MWIRSITAGPQASGICRDNSRDMLTTPSKPACYSDLISFKTANSAAVTLIGENPQPLSQAHYIMPVFASLSLPPFSFLSLCQCLPLIYAPFSCMRCERLSPVPKNMHAFIHAVIHSLTHSLISVTTAIPFTSVGSLLSLKRHFRITLRMVHKEYCILTSWTQWLMHCFMYGLSYTHCSLCNINDSCNLSASAQLLQSSDSLQGSFTGQNQHCSGETRMNVLRWHPQKRDTVPYTDDILISRDAH